MSFKTYQRRERRLNEKRNRREARELYTRQEKEREEKRSNSLDKNPQNGNLILALAISSMINL